MSMERCSRCEEMIDSDYAEVWYQGNDNVICTKCMTDEEWDIANSEGDLDGTNN